MKKRGFTLVELMIVVGLSIPVFYVMWNAFVTTRRTETGTTALASAARGACILERYLRADLSCLELSAGEQACTIADDSTVVLRVAKPGAGALTVKSEIRYELQPYTSDETMGAFTVHRQGRQLANVVVERFVPVKWDLSGFLVLQIEVRTLDPSLRRKVNGELYRFSTSLLAGLPWTPSSDSLVDYTLSPPE